MLEVLTNYIHQVTKLTIREGLPSDLRTALWCCTLTLGKF